MSIRIEYLRQLIGDGPSQLDYTRLATQHRPRDAQAIRAAVHELRNRGFGDYEIANATALDVSYVRRVLGTANALTTRSK